MMGLQATATKRKYEMGACGNAGDVQANCTPAKASRWSMTMSTNNNRSKTSTPTASAQQIIPSAEDSIAKLEAVAAVPGEAWGAEPIVDSISRLQAVAVPDTWGSDSSRSALATTLLSADDLEEDEDDFEDDFDEEESIIPSYSPIRYPCSPPRGYITPGYPKPSFYSEPYPQQNCSRTASQYTTRTNHYGGWSNHSYYIPPEAVSPQQTIRCAENGKSYLELGSSGSYGRIDPIHSKRCCDGRNNWCSSKQCYRDRRLKMRNLSMFKLSRFRQVSEQSLYRSVLICNTLKSIDREMEQEGKESTNTAEFHANHYSNNSRLNNNNNNSLSNNNSNNNNNSAQQELSQSPPNQYSSSDNSNRNFTQPYNNNNSNSSNDSNTSSNNNNNNNSNNSSSNSSNVSANNSTSTNNSSSSSNNRSLTSIISFNETLPPYDHHPLRYVSSGRATPFPSSGLPDTDSGYGDEDCTRSINWGSVLSLSSQSALDPLNNNDLFTPSTTTPCFVTTTTTATISSTSALNVSSGTNWEYNLLDMDLGLGPELTELLPSWKLTPLSADDILKSVPPPMEPSKILENEMDTLTHIMVGS